MTAFAILAAPFCNTGAIAGDTTKMIIDLVLDWRNSIEECRGDDSSGQEAACAKEKRSIRALNKLGWCYGRESDKSEADHEWHRCKKDSYRG